MIRSDDNNVKLLPVVAVRKITSGRSEYPVELAVAATVEMAVAIEVNRKEEMDHATKNACEQ